MSTTTSEGKGWTKGPWIADGLAVRAQRRGTVAECPTPQEGGVFECMSNGPLIAAAPDLYEALEYMVELFKGLAGDQSTDDGWKNEELLDVYERAQAALRKAEGRTP